MAETAEVTIHAGCGSGKTGFDFRGAPRLIRAMLASRTIDTLDRAACAEVVAWLRASHRCPGFYADRHEDHWPETPGEIADVFLLHAERAGFALQLVDASTAEAPAWVGHWTHRGSEFEGFKQPPYRTTPQWARVHACAALLRNQWCAARLL